MHVTILIAVLAASILISSHGFSVANRWVQRSALVRNSQVVFAGKGDLFADDLFEEGSGSPKKGADAAPAAPRKEKYLDENWSLDKEDQKDFDGFPKFKDKDVRKPGRVYPQFALMYDIRKSALSSTESGSLASTVAEHKGYCDKFKRIITSDVIDLMPKGKGVVTLFVGLAEGDEEKAKTKADVMTFMEESPFIIKDLVEKWDIIDLLAPGDPKDNVPASAET
ncbi:hypothetical protein B484DRAFT_478129 [Ochromonadaceae sp. CCMP2298]|nr:hypothetical protein B484DRAFT_478129 [Ochromonadaceae sp. CCMP2298]|mmetsp:Transcript_30194/g.66823  ORF Transcript_30194/g.66823 Transcript_30194/m.66823 type:complete len:224 (+) Transcript_30194:139-810(+)